MASDSLTVMPVHWGIHPSPTVVMPVKTGIQLLGSEDWIPAIPKLSSRTGITFLEHFYRFAAAQCEVTRLSADAETISNLARHARANGHPSHTPRAIDSRFCGNDGRGLLDCLYAKDVAALEQTKQQLEGNGKKK